MSSLIVIMPYSKNLERDMLIVHVVGLCSVIKSGSGTIFFTSSADSITQSRAFRITLL